ncbi:MAG: pilin [bacterium]|nr:pilin [bacterium]
MKTKLTKVKKGMFLLCVFLQSLFTIGVSTVYAQGGDVPIPNIPPPPNVELYKVLTNLANLILTIAGALVVVMVIIGGIRYIISAGNPQMVEGAKKTIIYALVGLAVIILSAAILNTVNFVLNKNGASGSTTGTGTGNTTGTGTQALPEDSCSTDSDCACGIHKIDKNCFFGNEQYVNTDPALACPDFCSGVGGNLTVKCVSDKCAQVAK